MRYEIPGMGICFLHEEHVDALTKPPRDVWGAEYANGWRRRSSMDSEGRVIHTRWIKPEEER